jgi:transposase InsO family protein
MKQEAGVRRGSLLQFSRGAIADLPAYGTARYDGSDHAERRREHARFACKREKPHWGARKVRELLVRRLDQDFRIPAKSTIHAVLHRHGLVKPLGRPRHRATGTPLSGAQTPNGLWCADFKGEFKLGDGRYCYPLTVTDYASRYLLLCEALESTREDLAITAFEQLFQERGLPEAIRSDNGVPFASPNALFNLSKLSVWWLRLGVAIERIKPGNPQQNGRHERMHLTLKKEATRPPGMNSLQQQARFDEFVKEFNEERPHEAIDMKRPAELYAPSPRRYDARTRIPLARPRRPRHRMRPNLHAPKTRQRLDRPCRSAPGNQRSRRRHLDRQLHELRSWLHRSGAEDLATPRQPVRPEVVTHVLGTVRYLCLRVRQLKFGAGEGIRTLDPNLGNGL